MVTDISANLAACIFKDNPTEENRERLVEVSMPTVINLVNKFRGKDAYEALLSTALYRLTTTISKFDPTKRAQYLTYLTSRINGCLKNHLRDQVISIKVPSAYYEMIPKYTAYMNRVSGVEGRVPKDREICDALDIDLEQLEILNQLVSGGFNPKNYSSFSFTEHYANTMEEYIGVWASLDGSPMQEGTWYDEVDYEEFLQHLRNGVTAQQLSTRTSCDYDKARGIVKAYQEYVATI